MFHVEDFKYPQYLGTVDLEYSLVSCDCHGKNLHSLIMDVLKSIVREKFSTAPLSTVPIF